MSVSIRVELGEHRLGSREVERLRCITAVGEHSRCTFRFHRHLPSPRGGGLAALLGLPVRVVVTCHGDAAEIFAGRTIRGRETHLAHGASRMELTALSSSGIRFSHRAFRHFPHHTLSELITALGAEPGSGVPAGPPTEWIQAGESEWALLREVAAREGLLLLAAGEGAEVRRGFRDSTHILGWGTGLTGLATRAVVRNHRVKGAFMDASERRDHRFHGIAQRPRWLDGAAELIAAVERCSANAEGGGDAGVHAWGGRAAGIPSYRETLLRTSERRLGGAVHLRGRAVQAALRPGDRIEIRTGDVWTLPVTGTFGLIRVRHRWEGESYENDFEATPWETFSPPPAARPRRSAGVVRALVASVSDPERLGRVRIRFPWMRASERTGWVRVTAPHAGNSRGLCFIPQEGDEVLIAFEEDDPERPFVIGSLWGGAQPPGGGDPRVVQLTTGSGSTLRFSDAADSEAVELHSAGGSCLVRLTGGAKPTLVVRSEGDLALEAPNGEIRMISCGRSEHVTGDAFRTVDGSLTEVVSGRSCVHAAGGMERISGTDMTLAAAGSLLSIARGTHTVSGSVLHLNPPVAPKPPAGPQPRAVPVSGLLPRLIPEEVIRRSTEDPPTPRSNTSGGGTAVGSGDPDAADGSRSLSWVALTVRVDGQPAIDAPVRVVLADGTEHTCRTDGEGSLRLEAVKAGACEIHLLPREKAAS